MENKKSTKMSFITLMDYDMEKTMTSKYGVNIEKAKDTDLVEMSPFC